MKIFFVFIAGAVFGSRLGKLQMKLFIEHHKVGKRNRHPKATSEKPTFNQLTWLLNQHKSMKRQISSAKHITPTCQHKVYNKYFMNYFRGAPFIYE